MEHVGVQVAGPVQAEPPQEPPISAPPAPSTDRGP
jgi:hypothetical protein